MSNGKRGFASMTPERRTEIARKGGASVPKEKRSFAANPELAAAAGRVGGKISGGNFKHNQERAVECGTRGGIATGAMTRGNPERMRELRAAREAKRAAAQQETVEA